MTTPSPMMPADPTLLLLTMPAQTRPGEPPPRPTARSVAVRRRRTPSKPKPSEERRRRAADELARDLLALHAEWRGALGSHRLRIDGQFQEALAILRSPARRGAVPLPKTKDAPALRNVIRGARLKPKKGRAKDLRRVEEALAELLERLPAA